MLPTSVISNQNQIKVVQDYHNLKNLGVENRQFCRMGISKSVIFINLHQMDVYNFRIEQFLKLQTSKTVLPNKSCDIIN